MFVSFLVLVHRANRDDEDVKIFSVEHPFQAGRSFSKNVGEVKYEASREWRTIIMGDEGENNYDDDHDHEDEGMIYT